MRGPEPDTRRLDIAWAQEQVHNVCDLIEGEADEELQGKAIGTGLRIFGLTLLDIAMSLRGIDITIRDLRKP